MQNKSGGRASIFPSSILHSAFCILHSAFLPPEVPMHFSLTLVDINPRVVSAWQDEFQDHPEVRVVCDSILRQDADAWVTPTNARGSMDGGMDAVMKRYFGEALEARVRREIRVEFDGRMPVGGAVRVRTEGLHVPPGGPRPRYLVSAATMSATSEDVSATCNAAFALAAALFTACGTGDDGPVRAVAVPGLGTNTGRLAARDGARQMRVAYELLRDEGVDALSDPQSLRAELANRLGAARVAGTMKPRKRRFLRIF
jgi:O-acetyl-ADP-ribose deacetylase (regulator of RNase III)